MNRGHAPFVGLVALLSLLACGPRSFVSAQEPKSNFNLALPTMGGDQLWTDHQWWYGWRLQQNAVTGHWRLLDLHDVRRAWGSREACQAELEQRTAMIESPTIAQHYVVAVHGLMRSTDSMQPLIESLSREESITPAAFGYASTRAPVSAHASALKEWVEKLPGSPRISFVGHSMGNIVVRRAIAMWQRDGDPKGVLPRLEKVVMLGPPNQGATIAKKLAGTGVFETLTGNSGKELGVAWDDLQQQLAIPPCPFCIVAGDVSNQTLQNPLVEGVSDFVVSVDETRLPGATEHISVPVLHSFLPSDERVIAIVKQFLKDGHVANLPGSSLPGSSSNR